MLGGEPSPILWEQDRVFPIHSHEKPGCCCSSRLPRQWVCGAQALRERNGLKGTGCR